MYIYTGGEPLVRKKDLIKLCEKHSDCVFLCFTNATLIDEDFANEMLRVSNPRNGTSPKEKAYLWNILLLYECKL